MNSGRFESINDGARWSLGGGFVVLPADNAHPNGVHSDGLRYYKLPADNERRENEMLLDTLSGSGVSADAPGGAVRAEHEVYKRFGNQYYYHGAVAYSWWFSPYGDGPISLTESNLVGDLINLSDDFPYRPYYAGGEGFTYVSGYAPNYNNAPRHESVPLVIYRNGKVLPFIDMSVTDSIPGFNTNGSLIVNGFGRCEFGGKERLLVSLLNLHTFQTWSPYPGSVDITNFGAQVVLLCYENERLIETEYTTPSDINAPANDEYFSICIWPWRFNPAGTECISITLEYRSNDIGADHYFIRVVRVPLIHDTGKVKAGTALIETYPIVISETVQDSYSEFGSPSGETVTWSKNAADGTVYDYNIDSVPIAADYDDHGTAIFTLLTVTSRGGGSYYTTASGTSTTRAVGQYAAEVSGSTALEIGGYGGRVASKSLSVNGMLAPLQNEQNSGSYALITQSSSWSGYSDLENPAANYYHGSIDIEESATRNYYGYPVTLIGYLSTRNKTLLTIGQRIGLQIKTSRKDKIELDGETQTLSGEGSYYYNSGFSSEIKFSLYVRGALKKTVVNIVAPDMEENSGPPSNSSYINGWPGEMSTSWDYSTTTADKRGVFPILNLFATSYTPYTPPTTSNTTSKCAANFVADFRKKNKVGWIVSIDQRPAADYIGIMDGRAITKANFHDNPSELLGHASPSSRFSTVGLF